MTLEEIASLERFAEAATPGPYYYGKTERLLALATELGWKPESEAE